MSETEIHPTWNAEKARAHLANLRADLDKQEAIHEAFSNAADDAWREVNRRQDQIRHCERMFSKPNPSATTHRPETTTDAREANPHG